MRLTFSKIFNRFSCKLSSIIICFLFIFSYHNSLAFIGNAQSGINQTYAILYLGGANNTYFDLYATTTNTDFQGANLGTFTCNGTLILKGGQSKVFKCSGGDITNSEIFYRIYKTGTTPGAFASIGIGFLNGFANGCGGDDQTWETANSTINILAGLTAGNYKIEVYTHAGTINNPGVGYWFANNNGNNYIADFTVNAPTIAAFGNQPLCFGQSGTISFNTVGTATPIVVTNNGNIATSPITSLVGGTYTLVATDANNCTAQATVGIAPIPSQIILTTTEIQPNCFGDFGTINFATVGGTGASTVTWFGGAVTSPMTSLFGFTYNLTATDANGCTATTAVTITEPPALQITLNATNPTCNGQLGQLSAGYTGGTPPLVITVNNALFVNNYPAGTYIATITDAKACTITDVATIAPTPAISVSASYAPIACAGDNAIVSIVATGGTGAIIGDGIQAPLAFTSGNTYTYTVSDANGCTGTTTITITAPIPYTIAFNLANNTSFASGANMSLVASAVSGGNIVSSMMIGPNGYTSNSNIYNNPVFAINAGVYMVTATNSNGCTAAASVNIIVNSPQGISIAPKVFLDGAYVGANAMMHDTLRQLNMIPTVQPYSTAPYNIAFTHLVGGGETIGAGVLNTTGTNAIVDWVFVAVRNASNPATIIATQAALVQRDGNVVQASDGMSPISFNTLPSGNYYISIQHRNHLGVMTSTALALSNNTTSIDFTNPAIPLYIKPTPNANPAPLSGATKIINGKRTLYAGNCKLSATSQTISCGTLPISDRRELLLATGGLSLPNAYSMLDVDMNGRIQFKDAMSDKTVIQKTCANYNTAIIVHEQLP